MIKKILFYCFLFIEFIIYCSYIYLDIHNGGPGLLSNTIKYTGIILCNLFFAFCRQYIDHTKSLMYIHLSLMFVLFCDYFLLFTTSYVWGVLLFCIIQFIYFLHIKGNCHFFKYYSMIVFITSLIGFIAQRNGLTIHFLEILSVFYFINLIGNIIISLQRTKKAPGNLRELSFAIGLILFLLCDINVGIVNLIHYIPDSLAFKWHLYEFSAILMWTFYLPAQIIIAVSTLFDKHYPFLQSES